jgi:hypothetical protein
VLVDLTRERLQAEWWFVPTIGERGERELRVKRLASVAAKPRGVELEHV